MEPNESLFPAFCPNCKTTYQNPDADAVAIKTHPIYEYFPFSYFELQEKYVCAGCPGGVLLTGYYPLKPE